MRRPARASAALLVVALLATGCGGDGDGDGDGSGAAPTTTTTTTTAPPPTSAPVADDGLAADLLTLEDLPAGWRPVGAEGGGGLVDDPIPTICGEGTVDLAAADERAQATFMGSAFGPFAFHALGRFGSDTAATAAFSTFVATVERCAQASGQEITFEPLEIARRGDQRHGLRLNLVSPIGRIGFDLGLTRYDDVLSLLMVGGLAPDPALLEQAAAAVDARR